MSWHFTSGGRSTGASTSASVLQKNIQGWFPLGLAGLISLLSKGFSRVFSSSTDQKYQFFRAYCPPKIHIVQSLPFKMIVLVGEAFEGFLSHESRTLLKGIKPYNLQRYPQPLPSHTRSSWQTRRCPSPDHSGTQISNFQYPKMWEINVHCL